MWRSAIYPQQEFGTASQTEPMTCPRVILYPFNTLLMIKGILFITVIGLYFAALLPISLTDEGTLDDVPKLPNLITIPTIIFGIMSLVCGVIGTIGAVKKHRVTLNTNLRLLVLLTMAEMAITTAITMALSTYISHLGMVLWWSLLAGCLSFFLTLLTSGLTIAVLEHMKKSRDV